MPDKEAIIKGLERFAECMLDNNAYCSSDCALFANGVSCVYVVAPLIKDAVALLKEQEAVKPEREHSGGGTTWWNVCGACGTAINPNDKFCHECGRAVKWDATD